MAVITGTSSADLLNGTPDADEISGLGGADTLSGGAGDDTLLGGNGSDSLVGGTGVDSLSGGDGNDVYVIDASDVLSDSAGVDTVRANFSYTLLAGFENLVLFGGSAIDGTGNGVANLITGNNSANTLSGSGGDDTLIGGNGSDSLLGGTGTDSLDGGAGGDTLKGGAGDDIYVVNSTLDVVAESAGAGTDLVLASVSYLLKANQENLTLTGANAIGGTGNSLGNVITGNNAANVLAGGGGGDTLDGGSGNDTLVYDAADGNVRGGIGTDTLRIDGSGVTLDLTVIANTVHKDLEVIDLTGSGNNMLMVARGDVIALSSTTNTLRVDGNAGDSVTTTGAGWLHALNVKIGAQTYAQYTNGAATLLVDIDVSTSIDTTVSAIQLSSLSGTNGFRLAGISMLNISGKSVASAGDVNGDGFADLIIGAPGANPDEQSGAGETYVVFGKASGFTSNFNLANLDGTTGFRVDGIAQFDYSGGSVASAGDVNGDGFDDLIIGARRVSAGGTYTSYEVGASYVVFGKASGFTSSIDLSVLDGTGGFRLDGVDEADRAGYSVDGAGDVNGDGFDDVIVGAYFADPNGSATGASYVVFGKASGFASVLDPSGLDGTNGFSVDGINLGDRCGNSVAMAGDVNGDGFDDLIIGAPGNYTASSFPGESYVVFGKASGFASSIDLAALDGTNGFRLDGIEAGDRSGWSVAMAGDVNGDGFNDVIIGAIGGDPGGMSAAGESYVVFGKPSGFTSAFDLATLDGMNGFRVDGVDAYDGSGISVAAAGDVNGDGFDDIIIGAYGGDPGGMSAAGESYVVFGKASGFASSIDLATLDGTTGFRLDGIDPNDDSGLSARAAGDVNGDGFDDLIIGARFADLGGFNYVGESYVVFGGDFTGAVTHLGTNRADSLIGTSAAEAFVSGQGNDALAGGGGEDVFNAGAGNDLIRVSSTTFAQADGGSGNDTLRLLGGNRTLDLTTLGNNKITGIETVDITGGGDNTLELAVLDLFDLSDTTNQLKVDGNMGDTVNLRGVWSAGGTVGDYDTYTQGAATIVIDSDISLFFV